MTLDEATFILADRTGFFPREWRIQAIELIEKQGTPEQKEVAQQKERRPKLSEAVR